MLIKFLINFRNIIFLAITFNSSIVIAAGLEAGLEDVYIIDSHVVQNNGTYINHNVGSENNLLLIVTENGSFTSSAFYPIAIISASGYEKYFFIENSGAINISKSLMLNINSGFHIINNGTINSPSSSGRLFVTPNVVANRTNKIINTINNSGVMNINIFPTYNNNAKDELHVLNSGIINGNITSHYDASKINSILKVDNEGGEINGNIDLGYEDDSYLKLDGGKITGNVVSRDSAQNIYINSGSLIGDIDYQGNLSLGNGSKTIEGNIFSIGGSAKLNLNSASQEINGNVSLSSGDTLLVTISADGSVGNLHATGSTIIANGVNLGVTIGEDYSYIVDGTSFLIVDGEDGSDVNAISDDKINVNESGTNKAFSVLTFKTSVSDNDMRLNVYRSSASSVSSNSSSQEVYSAIQTAGASATGALRNLQYQIDSASSQSQVESILRSALAQDTSSTKLSYISAINKTGSAIEDRTDDLHLAFLEKDSRLRRVGFKEKDFAKKNASQLDEKSYTRYILKSPRVKYSLTSLKGNMLSSNNALSGFEVWGQGFGNKAKQKNIDNDGYNSKANGIAFGADKSISRDARIGVAVSYTDSQVNSSDRSKNTNIDTYQFNLYGSKSYGQNFVDGIAGFAWNEYDSSRYINSVGAVANSRYSGQSYFTKLRVGSIFRNVSDTIFNITPEISTTFALSKTDSYKEQNADTLNLQVQDNSDEYWEGRVGVTVSHDPVKVNIGKKNKLYLTTRTTASYGYDFLNERQRTVANFSGQTAIFTSNASHIDPKSIKLGFGLDMYNQDSTTISLDYINERKNNYVSHSGAINFKYAF